MLQNDDGYERFDFSCDFIDNTPFMPASDGLIVIMAIPDGVGSFNNKQVITSVTVYINDTDDIPSFAMDTTNGIGYYNGAAGFGRIMDEWMLSIIGVDGGEIQICFTMHNGRYPDDNMSYSLAKSSFLSLAKLGMPLKQFVDEKTTARYQPFPFGELGFSTNIF